MTDRSDIARRLVLEKAVQDVLADANAETRAEAKALYNPGDADSVGDLGRVRQDKPRTECKVIDWAAMETWVREHAPQYIVTKPSVSPGFVSMVTKAGGVYLNKDTGEITEVPGIGFKETQVGVTVTTTDAAESIARALITQGLRELEA